MIRKLGLALAGTMLATGVAADPERSFSIHAVKFRDDFTAAEVFVRQNGARDYGILSVVYGLSLTTEGSLWAGVGGAVTFEGDRFYTELSVMPGLYAEGGGPDLGYPIEIRSGIEVGYKLESGGRIGIGIDHRSNNGWGDINPGLDTAFVRYTVTR